MNRLGEAVEYTKNALLDTFGVTELFNEIISKYDLTEVVHGKWLGEENGYYWYGKCSVCSKSWAIDSYYAENMNYCPNCGAKMDGEVNKNE